MISMLWPPEICGTFLSIKKCMFKSRKAIMIAVYLLWLILNHCRGHEPGLIKYDQSYMRHAYNQFVSKEHGMLHFRSNDRSKEMNFKRKCTEHNVSFN